MNRFVCGAPLLLLALLVPTSSGAHHVVSEAGVAWVEPNSRAEVSMESASFDHGEDWRGRYLRLSMSGEVRLHERFSVGARMPWALVGFDDGRGVLGTGDAEINGRALLFSSMHGGLILSAGLGAELPTGVIEDGLGAGHLELAPFVVASSQPWRNLIFTLLVVDALSPRELREDDAEAQTNVGGPHGAVISPHAAHQLTTRLTASWVFPKRLHLTTGAELERPWRVGDAERAPNTLWWRGELGIREQGRWRAALITRVPVSGGEEEGTSVSLAFARMFDVALLGR
jgi:hypothetical protein